MENIQISFIKENEEQADRFASILKENGYKVTISNENVSEDCPVLLLFYKGISKQKMLDEISWLKEQNERSSIRYLRLFPIFLFDNETNVEKDIDSYFDVFEGFISGEFKPYGFVLNEPTKYMVEFKRVLEESYSE